MIVHFCHRLYEYKHGNCLFDKPFLLLCHKKNYSYDSIQKRRVPVNLLLTFYSRASFFVLDFYFILSRPFTTALRVYSFDHGA